jgi:hypothetical protein
MTRGQGGWLDLSCRGLAPHDNVPVLIGAPQQSVQLDVPEQALVSFFTATRLVASPTHAAGPARG